MDHISPVRFRLPRECANHPLLDRGDAAQLTFALRQLRSVRKFDSFSGAGALVTVAIHIVGSEDEYDF